MATAAEPKSLQAPLRSVLGTTAGVALLVFSGSIFAWPIADLYIGPFLVLLGVRAGVAKKASYQGDAPGPHIIKAAAVNKGQVTILSTQGIEGIGVAIESFAAMQRPVLYFSLREATSSRDLHMAMLRGLYGELRLGALGTLGHTFGIYWLVLFDMLVSSDPCHNTLVNFEVSLQHGRRALRKIRNSQGRTLLSENRAVTGVLPLVIVDHCDEAIAYSSQDDQRCLHAMLQKLFAWFGAVCFDEKLADVVLIGGESFGRSSLPSWFQPKIQLRVLDNLQQVKTLLEAPKAVP